MERGGAFGQSQRMHVFDQMVVQLGDGRVDLHADAVGAQVAHSRYRVVERALASPECVLAFGRGKIERHRHAGDAMCGDFFRARVVDERAVRADDRPEPPFMGVIDDIPDVIAHQRLAAGEDEDGIGDGGDVIDDLLALFKRQLAGIGLAMGGGAAMGACEVTAARDLPSDDARRLHARTLLERSGRRPGTRASPGRRMPASHRMPHVGWMSPMGMMRAWLLRRMRHSPVRHSATGRSSTGLGSSRCGAISSSVR